MNDPLLAEAIAYAKTLNSLSISALQRRFHVGFNRAVALLKEVLQDPDFTEDAYNISPQLASASEKTEEKREPHPLLIKVLLADHYAQSQLSEYTKYSLTYFTLNEQTQPQDLNADLLFIVGNFDEENAQQAVNFCRQATTTQIMAIQLGQQQGIWADSSLNLAPNQTPAMVISEIAGMLTHNEISIDLCDFRTVCNGLSCHFISAHSEGEERTTQCEHILLSQFPFQEHIEGVISMVKSKDVELWEIHQIMSSISNNIDEDAISLYGFDYSELGNNTLSVSCIVACK